MELNGSSRTRVVLLGASGFIGSAVLRELAARPLQVRAVSRVPAAVRADAVAEVEVHTADLTEPGAMAEVVAGFDVVVNCVAFIAGASTWRIDHDDSGAERVNVGLARDLVTTARARAAGRTRVVFVGAVSQAGPPQVTVLDESQPDRPQGGYDRQKLAAESVLLQAHQEGVLDALSLRLPTVYGASQYSTARDKGVVSTMVRRAAAGEPITMWHDGTVRRDLVHVEDVARAIVAAVERFDDLAGGRWLLGSGDGRPLGEVFHTVSELVADWTGRPAVPVTSVDPPDHAEAADFRSFTVDSSAFRARTGWQPRVPLLDGLRRTVEAICPAPANTGGAS